MSAIAGILRLDRRPVESFEMEAMLDSVAHRCPDGRAHWCGDAIGLGYGRLLATSRDAGDMMPLRGADPRRFVVADARIDNAQELWASLSPQAVPRSDDPGALLLAAYDRWGEGCVERLYGDFAFAIWDEATRRLFCARDPMGSKPLYFRYQPGKSFAFASEIRALCGVEDAPERLNQARIADYLSATYGDGANTFYANIERFPSAHLAKVDGDRMDVRRYWSPASVAELERRSDDEYAECLRSCFESAVGTTVASDFPVGSMLSGGLDSSSVTCMAQRALAARNGPGLHTFSYVFDTIREADERGFIDSVLDHCGATGHRVNCDRLSPLAEADRLLDLYDEPLTYPQMAFESRLYQAASEAGIRVVLHGAGGDTVLSHGEMLVAQLIRSGNWIAAFRALRGVRHTLFQTYREIIPRYVVAPLVPAYDRELRRRRDRQATALVAPDFAATVGLAERRDRFDTWGAEPGDSVRAHHDRAVTQGALQHLLAARDLGSAAHRIEPRYPFYDRRLVELSLSLPADQRISGSWTRVVMRRAMQDVLPANVQWRNDKTSHSPYLVERLLDFDRDRLADLVHGATRAIDEYVDRRVLQASFRRLSARRAGTFTSADTFDALQLWRVAILSEWLDRRPRSACARDPRERAAARGGPDPTPVQEHRT